MNRRQLLAAVAGVSICRSAASDDQSPELPGLYRVTPNTAIGLTAQSTPVGEGDSAFSLSSLGTCRLELDDDGRLNAVVTGGVTHFAQVDYWISLAVFDEALRFLGAATHQTTVQRIRRGRAPMIATEFEFDFGISKAYQSAAYLAVAISECEIPA